MAYYDLLALIPQQDMINGILYRFWWHLGKLQNNVGTCSNAAIKETESGSSTI